MKKPIIYFDNAATSYPKPESVYEKMDQFLREMAANPGRSSHRMSVETGRIVEQARHVIAQWIGARDPKRIIFTLNGTDSLNIAIKGILSDGDHVVTTKLEHNSVLRPLKALEKSGKIRVTKVDVSNEGILDPTDIRRAILPKTKLVVANHGSNVIGTIQPVREIGKICRERDVIFLVDGAQTVGAYPVDVEKDFIDLLAFPGHKACFGPPGTGVLYVGERAKLTPWREGGTGVNSTSETQPEEFPLLLEGGTPNTVGIVGLSEGVRFLMQEGLEQIRRHECELLRKLREGLREILSVHLYGSDNLNASLATVSLTMENLAPQELGAILDESYGIAARTGLHCAPLIHQCLGTYPEGTVRLSLGYFNQPDEVDSCLAAIREIAKQFSLTPSPVTKGCTGASTPPL